MPQDWGQFLCWQRDFHSSPGHPTLRQPANLAENQSTILRCMLISQLIPFVISKATIKKITKKFGKKLKNKTQVVD